MTVAAARKAALLEEQAHDRTDVYLPNPTKDPVDRVALRRELMQRFSWTLAELAK